MSDETVPKESANMTTGRTVVITVDDSNLNRIDNVADDLRELGVRIDDILKATGLICGSTTRRLADLRKVPGVLSVEAQTTFEIPPPDAQVH